MFNMINLTDTPLIEKQKTAFLIGKKKVMSVTVVNGLNGVDGKLIE